MRALFALILIFLLAPPAMGADAALRGPSAQLFAFTILGKTFSFRRYRLEGPARTWAEIRPYLPRALYETPRQSLADRQIAQRVDALLSDRRKRYGAAIEALADKHLEEFRKKTPDADRELFQLVLAESCISNVSQGYIPRSVLRLCQEYTALLYVSEMLRETTGIDLRHEDG